MRACANTSGEFTAVGDPVYVQGRNRSEILAHFSSGTTVQVALGRQRRYPGLDGPAPATHLCYRRFLDLGVNSPRMIDVGCGSGIGLRCLLQTKARLTGIDSDGKAIAFARQYVSDAELIHADVHSSNVKCAAGVALVVDVLGLIPDPAHLLRSLLRRVDGLETLFVAEPIANRNQSLVPPARRAFGVSSLKSLFTRSGFEIDDWTTVTDTFLCAIGRPVRDPLADTLIEAEEAYLSHQTRRFEVLCRNLRRSGHGGLRLETALLESRYLFDMNDYARAIAVLTDACALAPEDPRPWSGLSRAALASGNTEHAIRLAEKAVRIDSSDLASVCSSALAQLEADPRRSLEAWKIANALAPDERTIAGFLCSVALSQGNHEEGLALLERVGQYQSRTSPLHEQPGLLALTTAALQRLTRG